MFYCLFSPFFSYFPPHFISPVIQQIQIIYIYISAEFGRNLEEDIESETSGYFKRLLVCQSTGGRDEGDDVDYELAQNEAQEIFDVSS